MQFTAKEFASENAEKSIEEKLKLISERPYMNMGNAHLDESGDLIVNGVYYQFEGKFACACPTVSRVKRDYRIPCEYCYRCGGQFKYHYEIMLGVKLEMIEIVSTPHDTDGEKTCSFKYKITR